MIIDGSPALALKFLSHEDQLSTSSYLSVAGLAAGPTLTHDDSLSIIIDPGAWTDLIDETLARSLARHAIEAGHKPSQDQLVTPLRIQGVGHGHQDCEWQIACPIAMTTDAGPAGLHQFSAPVVCGSGANLPGLIGLKSLEHHRAGFELRTTSSHLAGLRSACHQALSGSAARAGTQWPPYAGHRRVQQGVARLRQGPGAGCSGQECLCGTPESAEYRGRKPRCCGKPSQECLCGTLGSSSGECLHGTSRTLKVGRRRKCLVVFVVPWK